MLSAVLPVFTPFAPNMLTGCMVSAAHFHQFDILLEDPLSNDSAQCAYTSAACTSKPVYLRTHTAMQHAHASGLLYDDTHLQLALLSLQTPHLKTSFTCTTLCHMYLDLAHAHIVLTHCLTQLQDKVAVNVHHLNTPYLPLPSSLQ